MTFQQFVKANGGFTKTAKLLGVQRDSIHRWYAKRGRPRIETMALIIKLSKNKMTYESIIKSTLPV